MNLYQKHSILAGRILLVLFLGANSGFTTVIRQCAMESAHPMDCCSNTCENADGPKSQATIARVLPDCHSTTVVGGLNNTIALLEKESIIHSSKIIISFLSLQELPFSKTITTQPVYFSNPSLTFSPASAEKCVLNSTFLI
ncbi:MAG: hypothetical protein WBW71_10185 [Bacteroidota bacterium]